MAAFDYEELLPYFGVQNGTLEIAEGPSTAGFPGGPPTNAIQTDQAWNVNIRWETTGMLNYIMAGTWHLQLFLEQMGAGEFHLPDVYSLATLAFESKPKQNADAYKANLAIPAGTVPKGTYKLVFQMTFRGPAPANKPGPIACFVEYPRLLQFYEA